MKSYTLQHLVMPNLAFGAPEEMYVRLFNDKVHALMSDGRLLFEAGGRASFDTFFNSVTVGAWKTHTSVADVQLQLRGTGRFIVRLGLHRIGHAQRWLAEHVVTLSPDKDVVLPVESWAKLESGMLYFALEALEAGSLSAGRFTTCTAPQREVKLGIVITHFNRKQWVLPAISRIRNELLSDPLYKDRVELVVVDNSQNITSEEAAGITLISNKNLGGSGGFTRGLLYLKDQKDFTHCLFMDDDASCEIESIRRTIALFEYGTRSDISVAGALLRELEPWRLLDKGSNFDGYPTCDRAGLDVRSVYDLLKSEVLKRKPDFGGWWFLAFSVEDVKSFSYPFFVKCDDILFGVMNDFPVVTMNGVACLSDDFGLKEGPLQRYLDTRGRVVMNLVSGDHGLLECLILILRFILMPLFSHNYVSSQAAIDGLKDAMKGPSFWVENIDMKYIFERIRGYPSSEKMLPVEISDIKFVHNQVSAERKILTIFRWLTLNGILVPSFFRKKQIVFQPKGFRATLREIFLFEEVFYYYEPNSTGYIAKVKSTVALPLLISCFGVALRYLFLHASLKREYRSRLSEMTSEGFWRKVYGL